MTPTSKIHIADARCEEMRAGKRGQDGIYVAESVVAGAAGEGRKTLSVDFAQEKKRGARL
ncbi:hypothetical protein [Verminephrobacter aporrectodeae]|nr:hypothetical protein [Verminephrobacter aporrectodeae]